MGKSEDIKKPLKQWLDDFYDDTAKLSELVRNLALAGIGLIWIFKNGDLTQKIIPVELIQPLKYIVLGLFLDLLQYSWRAVTNYIVYRVNEWKYDHKKLTKEEISDVSVHVIIPFITWVFFIAKIVFIAMAYNNIYHFLIARI